jgi:AraC-like DNA-binding protein/mannose-6-phosphate isomerase-like protein (cupin superfamily)
MIKHQDITLKITGTAKVSCLPDWHWDCRYRSFDDFDFWCVLDGKGRMHVDGKTYDLSGGDCFMLYPGINFYADNSPEAPLTVVYTHFDILEGERKISSLVESPMPGFYRKAPDQYFFNSLLNRMLENWYSNTPRKAALWLHAAISELAAPRGRNDIRNPDSPLANAAQLLYRKINEYPESSYSLKKTARFNGSCPEHFSRVFKKVAGISFREAVTNAKIKRAELLLDSSGYSITQIAEIIGFGDIYHFSKFFKKHRKLSPGKFRKRTCYTGPRIPCGRALLNGSVF